MKKQMYIALLILFIAILAVILLIKIKPKPEFAAVGDVKILVDVVNVHKKDLPITVSAQGTVEPKKQTNLLAEVPGSVERVSSQFVVGGMLKKGDFILKISDSDYQLQIERAKASIVSAQSTLAQEKTLARIAQQEFDWRERKNLSAEAKDAALRKPQIRAARANVAAARVEIKNAQKQIAKTTIRAPYDGIVRSKLAEQGQFVSTGTPLGSFFSVESVNIKLKIPQEKLQFIEMSSLNKATNTVTVEIFANESDEEHTWYAKLIRGEGVVDPNTHFVNLIAEVNDPYNLKGTNKDLLRVGSFVHAKINGKSISNVIELSSSYIQSGKYVWLVDKQNKLEKREVSIGYQQGESTFISKGLNNGELVCKTQVTGYLPGTVVSINSVEKQLSDSELLNQTQKLDTDI